MENSIHTTQFDARTSIRLMCKMQNPDQISPDEASMIEVGDELDETPEFLSADDAVEVPVDDDVPMDDDEEDEEEEEKNATEETSQVEDTSKDQIKSHAGPVYAITSAIDPETKKITIVTGGGDDKAFLHQVSPGLPPSSVPLEHAHTDSVSCVALNLPYISEDVAKTPRLAAVGSYDGAIVLYDPDTGAKLQTLEGPTDVEWLSFHPKGGTVLLAGSAADGTIWMYHIPMNKCLQVFVGHESAVSAGSFSPDGKWALSASSDGTMRVWAPRTGASKHVFRLGAGLTCMDVDGGSDGQLVIVGAEDGQAHVCHIGTKKVVASLRHFEVPVTMQEDDEVELPMSVESVGFAPVQVNPNWCATGGVDGVLKIWDLAIDGQCRQICHQSPEGEQLGGITRLKWHPTLPLVFTSTTTGAVNVWDARNGALLHTAQGSADTINDMDVKIIEDGRVAVVLAACDDSITRIFEIDLGALSLMSS